MFFARKLGAKQTAFRISGFGDSDFGFGIRFLGGDTAFEIHKALGARDFRTCGEVVPGVPVSRCGDLIWITKAGGFGGPELLRELRNKLT